MTDRPLSVTPTRTYGNANCFCKSLCRLVCLHESNYKEIGMRTTIQAVTFEVISELHLYVLLFSPYNQYIPLKHIMLCTSIFTYLAQTWGGRRDLTKMKLL